MTVLLGSNHRMPSRAVTVVVMVLLMLSMSACGVTRHDGPQPLQRLRMMVPNSPGGGYDLTARTAVRILEEDRITGRIQVFNVTGAGGTVAMVRLMNERANSDLMMMMGLGVVGATYTNRAPVRATDATPLAKLVEDPGAIIVPASSPLRTIDDFIRTWQADPAAVTIGGGSSPGGPDHLFPMQTAEAVGIDPRSVNFITYDGGGDLLTALLGNKVTAGTSSPGEFIDQIESGQLRVLAVSSDERVQGIDAPTLKEVGVDITFANWRGVLAPPGISSDARQALVKTLEELHNTPQWRAALVNNGWTDAFLTGAPFEQFLRDQDQKVSATLTELGLM